ncbi:hypothetical protein [Roseateles sp.]|uniref:hypothetical protein n=1 Tax=Roseateles sp. TaxID=1971397 RepID=UPI0032653C41
MKASRIARFADLGPRADLRVALRLVALAALMHTPAAVLAQAGTFPGMEPGRVGGVAADGQNPDKAAAAAKNKQMEQELIDKQRDEAALRTMVEQRAKLRERLEREAGLLRQPVELLAGMFQLPADLKLSPEHRSVAEEVLRQQRERAQAGWAAWLNEETSQGKGELRAEMAAQRLSNRVLNEVALWQADTTPHPSDTIWIDALKTPAICQRLDQTRPAGQVAQLIEALPAEQRDAAWQGEAARLARWGQVTRQVPPAPDRAFEDELVAALPKPPGNVASLAPEVRNALQTPGWTYAAQSPASRCEMLRWWSQEQVRTQRMTAPRALHAWRTAMAVRSSGYLLPDVPRSGPGAIDANGFPLIARRAELAGTVVVEQDLDATGKIVRSFVQRREVTAAGVRGMPALALERELDAVSLARATTTPAVAPDPAQLRDGTATRRIGIEWVLPQGS